MLKEIYKEWLKTLSIDMQFIKILIDRSMINFPNQRLGDDEIHHWLKEELTWFYQIFPEHLQVNKFLQDLYTQTLKCFESMMIHV